MHIRSIVSRTNTFLSNEFMAVPEHFNILLPFYECIFMSEWMLEFYEKPQTEISLILRPTSIR
jgi:hypothetical protein